MTSRWTSQDLNRLRPGSAPVKAKGNKYGAQRAEAIHYKELAGRSFASRLERDRAVQLVILLRAGEIKNLEFQPQVYLTRAECGYKPDFSYRVRIAPRKFRKVFEEVKGAEGYPWLTNKKLWKIYGPAPLLILKAGRNGPQLVQTIIPKG